MGPAHLDALRVLQTFLEDREHPVGLEIHDKVGTTGEDAEGGLAGAGVGALCHAEGLGLERVPWASPRHGMVREIADGVDGFAAYDGGRFVQERV